ncbi:MAG: CRISPR-associated endonuclease Cas2 [Thermoplasmata archaeon HGW-Thermoplasmata-1]|nr:MAG: CRISPR-associated endonuclease Cas2 [Thermoplasmata archaeon HGW-Thermoplasmata-1]
MRKLYLVAYDIRDPKRLRRTFMTMRGFGEAMQYSVFLCDLSDKERVILMTKLNEIIHHDEDSAMIVDLGQISGKAKERIDFIGQVMPVPERSAIII